LLPFFIYRPRPHPAPHSFPTRRSSDLVQEMARGGGLITRDDLARYRVKWRDPIAIGYRGYTIYTMPPPSGGGVTLAEIVNVMEGDRKSTRLNSSHVSISYAVFCLKKKN